MKFNGFMFLNFYLIDKNDKYKFIILLNFLIKIVIKMKISILVIKIINNVV